MTAVEPDLRLGLRLLRPGGLDVGGWLRRGVDRSRALLGDRGRDDVVAQAVAAHARGNRAAAYWLAREAFEASLEQGGDDELLETSALLWRLAVEHGCAADALSAASRLVAASVRVAPDSALEVWLETGRLGLEPELHPAVLARLLEPLAGALAAAGDDQREELGAALARTLDRIATADALEPPVALRAVSFARDRDRDAARRLARRALQAPQLHEVKRARLEALLADPPSARERTGTDQSIWTDLEPVGDDATVDAVASLEPDSGDASHPGHRHPLYAAGGAHERLSDDEIERMRARIEQGLRSGR